MKLQPLNYYFIFLFTFIVGALSPGYGHRYIPSSFNCPYQKPSLTVERSAGIEKASLNAFWTTRMEWSLKKVLLEKIFELSPVEMVLYRDKDGAGIAEAARYSPYGKELGYIVEPSSDLTREKFTGKELDTEGAVDYSELELNIFIIATEGIDNYSDFKDADKAEVIVSFGEQKETFQLTGKSGTIPSSGTPTYSFRLTHDMNFYDAATITNVEIKSANSSSGYNLHCSITDGLDEEIDFNTTKKIQLNTTLPVIRIPVVIMFMLLVKPNAPCWRGLG